MADSESDAERDRRAHRRVDLSTSVTLRTTDGSGGESEFFEEAFLGSGDSERDDHLGLGDGGHGLEEEAETLFDGAGADLSLGGMYIRSTERLPESEEVEVEFRIDEIDVSFDLRGEVRWIQRETRDDGTEMWGMGIQFVETTEHQREMLEEFVRHRIGNDNEA